MAVAEQETLTGFEVFNGQEAQQYPEDIMRAAAASNSVEIQEVYRDALQSIYSEQDLTNVESAEKVVGWLKSVESASGGSNEATDDLWSEAISRTLPALLGPEAYDEVGSILSQELSSRAKTLDSDKIQENYPESPVAGFSSELLGVVVGNFYRTGYVRINQKGQLELTKQAKKHGQDLSFSSINNADVARSIIEPDKGESLEIEEIYRRTTEESSVDTVSLESRKKSSKVLYLSELLIGHKDSDIEFFKQVVKTVGELPEKMKPDAVVMSGLIMGDFKYYQKNRRATLAGEFNSMDRQFEEAKKIIDLLGELGVPVVYNLGDDDHRIAKEYTVEMMRKLQDLTSDQESVTYYQVDQMQQHPKWNELYRFQVDVALPYCLRQGKRLRSAEEMNEQTSGEVDVEEALMLFQAYQALRQGMPADPSYAKFLNLDYINLPNRKNNQGQDFYITDNFDLETKVGKTEYTAMVRHHLNFSNEPMYGGHMATPVSIISQMQANGDSAPDTLITQHNQEGVGVAVDGSWVISTPGFVKAGNFINSRGSTTSAPGDISKRLATTRRRIPETGATMHETTADGRHIVTILNKVLMEKADSLEDRSAVIFLSDWQTGSVTARADYQVKMMDLVSRTVLPEHPTVLFWGGDIVQGRNYADMPNENQGIGLISVDAQKAFVQDMVGESLQAFKTVDIPNLQHVGVIPGNHEWNSGTQKWHGDSFVDYLASKTDELFMRRGLDPETAARRAKKYSSVVTPEGEFFTSYTAIHKLGAYGLMAQHLPLERGSKGGSGSLPIYQAHQQAVGVGKLRRGTDIEMYGHWHHPQYLISGNRAAAISGSLAGLSGYEWMRGYRPVISGMVVKLGGKLPPQIEFISRQALIGHKIKDGPYSKRNLANKGFVDDKDFDPFAHGIIMPEHFPKGALQKYLIHKMRQASQRASNTAMLS